MGIRETYTLALTMRNLFVSMWGWKLLHCVWTVCASSIYIADVRSPLVKHSVVQGVLGIPKPKTPKVLPNCGEPAAVPFAHITGVFWHHHISLEVPPLLSFLPRPSWREISRMEISRPSLRDSNNRLSCVVLGKSVELREFVEYYCGQNSVYLSGREVS